MPDQKKPTSKPRRRAREPKLTEALSGIEAKAVEWMWWPWIPMGKLTILDGEPEVGKSTMTIAFAALVSRGRRFPLSTIRGIQDPRSKTYQTVKEPSNVILVGVEDDAADTVRPRLDAAGADSSRVRRMMQELDDEGLPIPFVIPDDVHGLRDAIVECDARLVIIDPITAFISETVKTGQDGSNRKALMALAAVAEETGAAIVLVRHLNKAQGMSAKNRGGGSIAFTALARSVLVAGNLPPNAQFEDPAEADLEPFFVLARTKGNLAPAPDSHGYKLKPSPDNKDVATVHWSGPVNVTADQVVGAEGTTRDARRNAPERDEAARVIAEILADGPMSAKDAIKKVVAATGVSEKTVQAARRSLNVETKQERDNDGKLKG